mmetsp:Transcript_7613/g.14159  ORF Transcript_7613/g.14159 Transcript_7613/m.14159 type:complete len:537 (+) Transcript_7613:158-1768(+)
MAKHDSQKRRQRSSSSGSSELERKRQKGRKEREREREKERDRDRDREREKDRERGRSKDSDKSSSRSRDRRHRSTSSESSTVQVRSDESEHSLPGFKDKRRQKKEQKAASLQAAAKAAEKTNELVEQKKTGVAKKPVFDLTELQKQLDEERSRLQLYVLKAKQEHEEKQETSERRDRREKEYYKPSWGEPVGPENRFLLEGEVGKGAFSTVFRCRDTAMGGKEYAIKFIRQNAMLRKATEKEVKLMRRLRNAASVEDPEGARCFLSLAGPETFEHQGHLAVVFQLQRCDLRSGLQKYGQGKGLPLPLVQCYARNIFMALRALKKVNVVHSDLKPDNLLMTMDKASVKLSDFGSAMDVSEVVRTDYVQPRFYRSPEVILGQVYGVEIDYWSAALTLFELATGRILLQGRSNNDMIHESLKVCGPFPRRFATSGDFASRHFRADGSFRCVEQNGNGESTEVCTPMSSFIREAPPQPFVRLLEDHIKDPPPGSDEGRHQMRLRRLADLVSRLLVPVPAERWTPEAALDHAFFQKPAPTR